MAADGSSDDNNEKDDNEDDEEYVPQTEDDADATAAAPAAATAAGTTSRRAAAAAGQGRRVTVEEIDGDHGLGIWSNGFLKTVLGNDVNKEYLQEATKLMDHGVFT